MTTTCTMIDAMRVNAHNIPAGTLKVAGYDTGSGDVPWTAATWGMFPHAGHVRIDQSPSLSLFAAGDADAADIEYLAGTVDAFAGIHTDAVKARIAKGITWSTAYATDSTLAIIKADLDAAGPHGWYFGHVDCWLADWALSEAQAAALIGREVHGLTCRAVQWASPSSNASTIVPGGTLTLAQAQVDLSVADEAWHPAPGGGSAELDGHVTWWEGGSLHNRGVMSADAGKTWR